MSSLKAYRTLYYFMHGKSPTQQGLFHLKYKLLSSNKQKKVGFDPYSLWGF